MSTPFHLPRRRSIRALIPAALVVVALTVVASVARRALQAEQLTARRVTVVAREVVTGGGWEIVERHAQFEPHAGVLTPSLDYTVHGNDLPSIVMPPPSEVRFEVAPEDGPVTLRMAAGLDHSWPPEDLRERPIGRAPIAFEVEVNGAPVFQRVIDPKQDDDPKNRRWRRVAGRQGIQLEPGDVVTLRTRVLDVERAPEGLPEISAGFGDIVLEHDVQRHSRRATVEAPNVVLIVMDTLRADRLSCYGYDAHGAATTEVLDALAARGTLFEQAYATSSWTWPSTASILTGLWPETHGVVDDGSCWLAGEHVSLAEALAERDYVTAAFACNPLIVADKNFDQGFESFDDSTGKRFRLSADVLPEVESWIGEHADERFFLYVHLVDTHFPYDPLPGAGDVVGCPDGDCAPEGYPEQGVADWGYELRLRTSWTPGGEPTLEVPEADRRWMNDAYDMAVWSMDKHVGTLLDRLEELGLDDRTVVAFTSDHGEELCDHDSAAHGHSLYCELVRVPLILAGPGIPAGERVATPVSNRHVAPTLARLGGAALPALEDPLYLDDVGSIEARPIFFSTEHGWWNGRQRLPLHGVRRGDWVLHFAPTGRPWGPADDDVPGELALYHLPTDPTQQVDVAAQQAELVAELRELLLQHLRRAGLARPSLSLGAGGGTLQLLRDIGYIGDG